MKKIIQVCMEESAIDERIFNRLPNIDYEIIYGKNCDFTIGFNIADGDDEAYDHIDEVFDDVIYNFGGRYTLQETLVMLAKDYGLTFATAESCTGGKVASAIVDVAGCSEVFYEGVVTYSNDAKMDRLGVAYDTLLEFGAVSKETAIEMASGLLDKNVNFGISTTGIAGPDGGTSDKPVGLVYMAVCSTKMSEVFKHIFAGSRNSIREKAKNFALFHAINHIKKNY